MKIGLVGWGVETKSAFQYFGAEHSYLIVNEEPRDDFPTGNNIETSTLSTAKKPGLSGNSEDLSYLNGIADCEQIVISPTSRKNLEKHFSANDPVWQRITTIQDIFFEQSPTKNIIGVTGTKGKGTTTTLTAELLKAAGKDVYVAGNIGISVLDILPKLTSDSWAVLELSSFQLYKFKHSPHIAIHLMMVPEHIEEWHLDMDDYVNAKRNLCANQKPDDICIYLPSNNHSSQNAQASPGKLIPYTASPGAFLNQDQQIEIEGQNIISANDLGLIGKHNQQNICAALTAAWQVVKAPKQYAQVLESFTGLEHRLQLVRELDGVKYYDDSFGTVPNTAQVALDAFAEPKILILGGHDKGNDWSDMLQRLKQDDVKQIILIGSITSKLSQLMQQAGVDMAKVNQRQDGNSWTMKEIVEQAKQQAKPGEIVLLSTGCASFGLFADYKDRGNQFIQAVNQL